MRNAMAPVDRCESLGRMIEETARRHPRRRALILEKGAWSYRSLNSIANRYAHAFREKLGLAPSDRVAMLLSGDVHYIFASLGAFKAGAAVVPLNCFLTAPELKFILADSAATVLVTSDQFAPVVRKFSDELPALKALVTVGREDLGNDTWLCEEFIKGMDESDPGLKLKRSDLAVIIYTSGTTGKPKGAMLTHGNLLSNVAGSGTSIRIGERDRILLMLPMFHSFTLTACILMPLSVGAGIVPVGKVRSIPSVVKSMVLKRATILVGIPHIYDVMAERGIPWWLRRLLRLRVCISGSAPLSEATLKRFEARIGIPLLEGYGLSETSPVVSINPLQGPRKVGSVGKPIPGVAVRIVSGDGVELPRGRIGEIAVKGPNVMMGYLNHPRETKETIRGGWLLTGDIGKIDDDGYIYILDRKKDMILFHGMNVYPREIEEILFGHPAVAEAAVVGKPDPRRGEAPVAFVSLKEGERVEPSALIKYCKQFLAGYKVPHRIVISEKLPRSATGKILKRELRKAVAMDQLQRRATDKHGS
jgi:long-chain acyl-CoA synthetase